MARSKHIKLQRIKGLMLVSQVLLLLFTAQWLYNQYNDQQEQLKKNLTKIFTDVQQRITDSLLLTHVIDPVANSELIASNTNINAASGAQKVQLSPQGLHRVLTGASSISNAEERKLFGIDTILFNEMFTSEMKHNGWNFDAEWINSEDSNSHGKKAIFIQSSFFTNENGVVIKDYRGYLFLKLLPQLLFVVVLLTLTAAAFWMMLKNLKSQMKLSELKDDFINNMSHELKTPIATVKVALEALTNFNAINDAQRSREYLGMATSEMDRLELLATRVLNTSLLESGKIDIQRESYDLKALVTEVLQSMQLRFDRNAARVTFNATGSDFLVPVDKLHMQGVLVNLLDNSMKYGPSSVNINIDLTEHNGAVRLALSDDGPGIPEEYKERVFEKFFRVPSGNRHNAKGYGLGLNYAAQIMRLHNGSIDVNNVASGGCVFTLTF